MDLLLLGLALLSACSDCAVALARSHASGGNWCLPRLGDSVGRLVRSCQRRQVSCVARLAHFGVSDLRSALAVQRRGHRVRSEVDGCAGSCRLLLRARQPPDACHCSLVRALRATQSVPFAHRTGAGLPRTLFSSRRRRAIAGARRRRLQGVAPSIATAAGPADAVCTAAFIAAPRGRS